MSKRIVAIVQARMASTRLPGKVLKLIEGRPLLHYLVERIRRASRIDEIVIATTVADEDNAIVDFCVENQIRYFRGAQLDVLSRYAGAATENQGDCIVRICSDSPVIDTGLIDEIVMEFTDEASTSDYLSNTIDQTFPLGMNVEIFSVNALMAAYQNAKSVYEREHVTPYIYFHPEQFKIAQKHYKEDLSKIRLTVDEQADFELIDLIIRKLYHVKPDFTLQDILSLLRAEPELVKINAHIQQTRVEKSSINLNNDGQ